MPAPMLPSGRPTRRVYAVASDVVVWHLAAVDVSWYTVPRCDSETVTRRRAIMTHEASPPRMRPYGRQILICEHGDCAAPEAAQRLAPRSRSLARGPGCPPLRN